MKGEGLSQGFEPRSRSSSIFGGKKAECRGGLLDVHTFLFFGDFFLVNFAPVQRVA